METDPQLLARLIKTGGRILVVGGGLGDLPPRYREHPSILLWDDDRQGMVRKEVPQNTKAILFSRWVSHATAHKLNEAAKQLHALKFPMLRSREIKALLSEVISEEKVLPADIPEPTVAEVEKVIAAQEAIAQQKELESMPVVQPGKKGTLVGFVAKNLNLETDWTQKGSLTREGERIYALAEKEGVSTTPASVLQCVRTIVKSLGKPTFLRRAPHAAKVKTPRQSKKKLTVVGTFTSSNNDDFTELERLMEEAMTAIRLVQEHLPKVRSETERLRGLRQKMLDMLKG